MKQYRNYLQQKKQEEVEQKVEAEQRQAENAALNEKKKQQEEEFNAAVDILNEYLAVFSRLIKAAPCYLTVEISERGKSVSVEGEAENH